MFEKLKEVLIDVKENEPIAPYTTFKLGGPAKYFYNAKTADQLLQSVKVAEELGLPYFIIGWASNMLVSDNGFDGLLIKNSSENITVNGNEIIADSGVNISRLVGEATKAGLSGLEFAAGIPGTVGGAIFGNAGAYGKGFGEVVKSVKIYRDKKVFDLPPSELGFSYRQSNLKDSGGIILSANVLLEKVDNKIVQSKIVEILKGRKDRVPFEPSAGCVFKNFDLSEVEVDRERIIKELDITAEEYDKATSHGKLAVGYIFDKLGLKGKIIGGCQISPKHSAFFVNIGNCKAEHVMMLISDVKMRVRNQLGLQLQEEIRYLGF